MHSTNRRPIRRVLLQIEEARTGGLRVESPDLPGWVRVAKSGPELARVFAEAQRELQVAAYARRRGALYDAADLAPATGARRVEGAPVARAGARPYAHDVAEWTPLASGAWRAPNGGEWPAGSGTVARVRAARWVRGLPVAHPDDPAPPALDGALVEKARARADAAERAARAAARRRVKRSPPRGATRPDDVADPVPGAGQSCLW